MPQLPTQPEKKISTNEDLTDGISVVIPFFNRTRFLNRLLHSIASQTLQAKHILIIDNGSTYQETTQATNIINQFTSTGLNILFISTLKKGNANPARNLGIQLAPTRYVAFLDSDDWWEPTHLEASLSILRKTNKSAIYSGAIIHRKKITINRSSDVNKFSSPFDFIFSPKNHIAQTSSFVIDKTGFKNLNLWDESLKRHQDFDFFFSVHFISSGWAFNQSPTTHIDWNNGGSKKNVDYKSMIRFLTKWKTRFPPHTLRAYLFKQTLILSKLDAPTRYYNYFRSSYIASSSKPALAGVISSPAYLRTRSKLASLFKES